jgi:hypothetical protein
MSYRESLILEELEDDLFELCGVGTRHDPQDTWLDRVEQAFAKISKVSAPISNQCGAM